MDMTREDFDEYRTRSIGVSRPDSAGDMGDDECSITYESTENDAPYDFIEGGNDQQTSAVSMSPEVREFLGRVNDSTLGLPGVNQFDIPAEETAQPQLAPAFEYTYPQPPGNIGAESGYHVTGGEANQEGQGDILRFSSSREANDWSQRSSRATIDTTIPQTIKEKKDVVRALLRAMKSVEFAEDNEGMVKPFRDDRYSETLMEVECWNVLEWCIRRHTDGPLLASYEHVKVKRTSEIDDFQTRMGNIIDVITRHKTICKHLLDAPYALSLVDDPVGCKNRVVANKALNKRKGEVMTAGKEALGGTPTPGARGRPRKRETPGSSGVARNEPTSSSAGPSRTRKNPRETPKSRADSNIPSGYVPAGTSTLTMESPTPASHFALRDQRRHRKSGSLGDNDAAAHGEQGNTQVNPYDPNLPASDIQDPQDLQKPGPGPRKSKKMGPPPTTPARSTRGKGKNTTSGKGRKRPQQDSDDQDHAPTQKKKSHR